MFDHHKYELPINHTTTDGREANQAPYLQLERYMAIKEKAVFILKVRYDHSNGWFESVLSYQAYA